MEREPWEPEQCGEGTTSKEWINMVRTNVKKAHPRFHPTNQHTIFRAPNNIRQSNIAAYEPSFVRIGPLHYIPGAGDALENSKWRFLRCLLSRCQNDASRVLDRCLMELESRDAEVRGCYSVDFPHINSSKLATMMLLDGSFILYFLLWWHEKQNACSAVTLEQVISTAEKVDDKVQESRTKEQEKGNGKVMGVSESDLGSASGSGLGLGSRSEPEPEPVGVSESDSGSRSEPEPEPEPVGVSESDSGSRSETEPEPVGVLGSESRSGLESGLELEPVVDIEIGESEFFDGSFLESLWTWNLITYDLLKLENQIPFFIIKLMFENLFRNVDELTDLALNLFSSIDLDRAIPFLPRSNEIHHLLHLFYSSIVTQQQVSQPVMAPAAVQNAGKTPAWIPNAWIPNATELAMAGVKFKQKEKFDSFLDVSFENGVLEIPLLQIDDFTNPLFRNLIAFEQCFPMNTDIAMYANFMDCIIDTANDVRLLKMKGILINWLSTDDEVASLFNQLCNQICYDFNKNYLSNVFAKVTKYHESKWHRWRAVLVRDYFNNPWVIISVLAAVLLLLLTVEQSFFTAFSYFRPP